MLQRTAADIVGVPNTKITVEPVNIYNYVHSLNNLIKQVMKLINLPYHKLKVSDINYKQVRLNKWELVS